MPGHDAVAARALRLPAAVPAQDHRREAAPVEEHQSLFTTAHGVFDGGQGGGQQRRVRGGIPGIQQLDIRQRGAARPFAQTQPLVTAGVGQMQGFQGRSGAAVDNRNVPLAGAPHCQVPGVVAETVLLLQGPVMGFVDDDQPRRMQRCEYRRTGADNDACPAFAGGKPGFQPFAVVQA